MRDTTSPPDQTEETWLPLQATSKLLGVHPTTLRQWADQGRIRVVRTLGGHRRFALADIEALLLAREGPAPAPRPGAQLVVQSALGRTHLEVVSGRLAREPWYQHFDEAMKARHRELGRSLLGLLLRYLNEAADRRGPLMEQGCAIGVAYADVARASGLSLSETVSAFLVFRDFLLESVIQGQQLTGELGDVHSRINHFVNSVMLAMLRAYEQGDATAAR